MVFCKNSKAFVVFFAFCGTASVFAAEVQQGEIIVKYKDGTVRTREAMTDFYQSSGVKKVHHFSKLLHNVEHWVLREDVNVDDALSQLHSNPLVEYAQPDYILYAQPIANADIQVGPPRLEPIPCLIPGIDVPAGCAYQPPLQPAPAEITPLVADPDLNQLYGMSKIGAVEAWTHFRGSKNFVVAVIDTGIDYNHEDLSFNLWRNPTPDATAQDVVGYDFVHDDGAPYDDNGHGTHVSGTIGAVGGNGLGVSGVSPAVSLMSLKFLSGTGGGKTSDAIKSVEYAVAHGARVINNSWGGQGDMQNPALAEAIVAAGKSGVLVVTAAGNNGMDNDQSPTYPASFPEDNIIAVAATDADDNLASFSNYGHKSVHLAAPGVNILSTMRANEYKMLSGTSMACPHVSGAAALIWAKHPKLNYRQIKNVLINTVDPVAGLKDFVSSGGRLNVLKAMNALGKLEQETDGLRSKE